MHLSTENVKNFFHSYAAGFDAIYGRTAEANFWGRLIDRRFRQVMFLRMMETLEQTAKSQISSILDVGCGPGRYCLEWLNQGKKVVALDIASGMIEIARELTNGHPNAHDIEFILGDYLEVNLPAKYDAACLMGFFDYIEDPVSIFKKLQKDVRLEIYASFPKSGGLLAWQRKIRYQLRRCPLYLYSFSDVENILRTAGLENKYQIKDLGRDLFVKISL